MFAYQYSTGSCKLNAICLIVYTLSKNFILWGYFRCHNFVLGTLNVIFFVEYNFKFYTSPFVPRDMMIHSFVIAMI